MPTGRVKTFDAARAFGFVIDDDSGRNVYVNKDDLKGTNSLTSGDLVEFEIEELDRGQKAVSVSVVRPAPADSPIGRVLVAPPDWDDLEDRDRQARQARRRRR
ncbi:MAG TPA: cold shock domain-containing protein [Nitriliruptorales bacterium]